MIRRLIVFRGRVQGVGFRYRARRAAMSYGCTGWVRNERDGSVVMEIQGTEEAVGSVLLAVQSARPIQILSMKSRIIPVVEGESGFGTGWS